MSTVRTQLRYPGLSIAKELENRLVYLSDPKVIWRRAMPASPRQSCLVDDFDPEEGVVDGLSVEAQGFLDDFVGDYAATRSPYATYRDGRWLHEDYPSAVDFNDRIAKNRKEVLWMLEEAAAEAKARGI